MFGDLRAISAHNAMCCQLLDIGGDSVSGRAPKVEALMVQEPPCLLTDRSIFACCQHGKHLLIRNFFYHNV